MTQPAALQLCAFSEYFERELGNRFSVVRWFELDESARSNWLLQNAGTARAVITAGNVGCSTQLMQALPALVMIAVNGVGLDKIDLDFTARRGIRVATTPGALTEDVADLAVGLIISLLRGIPAADTFVRGGYWLKGDRALSHKVSGRRFGIVGLGHIGAAIATRLAPFGSIAYTGPARKAVQYDYCADALALASVCDVLVVACPANAATRHMINAQVLEALGRTGYLINIARGSVVDEAALITALAQGRIAGAALDVYENEPHVPQALVASSDVVLTPHMASATIETRRHMADMLLAALDESCGGCAG